MTVGEANSNGGIGLETEENASSSRISQTGGYRKVLYCIIRRMGKDRQKKYNAVCERRNCELGSNVRSSMGFETTGGA